MSVFTHVVLGTNDLERARKFYDKTLATLGHKRIMDMEKASIWGKDAPALMVTKPANGLPATYGNGSTLGLAAGTRAQVDAFHAAGLAAGGMDEGAPGPRPFTPTAYGAYLRDPDGNKICAYCFAAP